MLQLIIVSLLVIIAGVYLFRKLQTGFKEPYQGCANCSCSCSDDKSCDTK